MSVVADSTAPTYDAYPFDLGVLIRLFIIGAVAGASGWLLYLGVSQFFIEPVFCRNAETFSVCNNGGTIAWITAHVIVMAATVAVLARMAVYRPLLVVLGVLLSLWGAHAWLGGLEWYFGVLWQALLFGLAVALFGWVARTANFVVAVIVSVVLIVLARLVLMTT
jgi:hypothetical protein